MKPYLRVLSLTWFLCLLAVLSIHILARDRLFFHSDFVSISLYLSGLIGLIFLPSSLVTLAAYRWLPRKAASALAYLAVKTVTIACGWVFLIWTFRSLFPGIATEGFQRSGMLYGGALLLAGLLAMLNPRFDSLKTSVIQVGGVGLSLWVLCLGAGWPLRFLFLSHEDAASEKHTVLIVLDALPPQFLHSLNPEAKATSLDSVLAEGTQWSNMYTWTPWTHAWFGTLYTGRSQWDNRRHETRQQEEYEPNLFGLMQDAGIHTRWVAFHRNGTCEGSAGHSANYRGLRSNLLGPGLAWLPHALGLDYNIILSSDSPSDRFAGNPIRRLVFAAIHPKGPKKNVFTEELLPEMGRLENLGKRTFLVFHVRWNHTGASAYQPKADTLHERMLEDSEAAKRILSNDYTYAAHDSEAVEFAREIQASIPEQIDALGERLLAFRAALRSDKRLSRSQVLITADHGSIFSRGKMWYAFHADEEVLRVPLAWINGPKKSISGAYFTPDLPATLLAGFGIQEKLGQGEDLFHEAGRDSLFSLTMKSDLKKEWWLALYRRGYKYRINVHPEAKGDWEKYAVEGMKNIPLDSGYGWQSEFQDLGFQALRWLGISGKEIALGDGPLGRVKP